MAMSWCFSVRVTLFEGVFILFDSIVIGILEEILVIVKFEMVGDFSLLL